MDKLIKFLCLSLFLAPTFAQEKIDTIDELIQQMTLTGVGGIDVAKVIDITTQFSYSRTKEYPYYSVVVSKVSPEYASISINCDSRKHENSCVVNEVELAKKIAELGIKKISKNESRLTTKEGIEIKIINADFGEHLYSISTFRQFVISYTYRKPKTNQINLW